MGNVVDAVGNINYTAAASADPGVMRCRNCNVYLWREGKKVQCPDCDHIWEPWP